MKLIVGLGNIGEKYKQTRHNAGFVAIDRLAQKYGLTAWKEKPRFHGMICTAQMGEEKLLLLKPNTYMNLSGQSIAGVREYYHILTEDIIVLHDDLDLPYGTVRMKTKGGHGGQNGIRDIIKTLKSDAFYRIKIGIGSEARVKMPTSNFVLSRFTKPELAQFDEIYTTLETRLREIFKK